MNNTSPFPKERTLKSQDIISVVISAYNSEGTITATLQSLEDQDVDASLYEVIVVDDGSNTPRTREIVEGFQNRGKMHLLYKYQENKGVGIARNAGVALSVGKTLAFTDADCICDKNWIRTIHKYIVEDKRGFIGGDTYSDDTVIFPWKMAPVGQSGITANLAVDFTRIDDVLFDSGFTGMLGDDTDFVLRMEERGMPLVFAPEMKVLHPPNLLTLRRVRIRARGRHNEVGLYKKHGKKVLSSFSFIFRPIVCSRISLFSLLFLSSVVLSIMATVSYGIIGLMVFLGIGTVLFYLFLYRFLVIYNPDNRAISWNDRTRTLLFLSIVAPLFIYYRLVGSIKFRFFML